MIIQNAIMITENHPEEIFLVSSHVHDFRTYQFKDGTNVFVDGGNDYIRRGGTAMDGLKGYGTNWMEWCLDSDEPFDTIKQRLLWGTRGLDGQQPLKYVRLVNCETSHLGAILKTQTVGSLYLKVIKSIISDRKKMSKEMDTIE